MTGIPSLLREIYADYAKSVELDPSAKYLYGTPLRPVVPLDTCVAGVFILGAYPSTRFSQIDGISDVPVADNLGPFEDERWFDGARVRKQPSAQELKAYFLDPLGLKRGECWITNLVKVFPFKPGHEKKYEQLRAVPPPGYVRDRFFELGRKSLPWVERELNMAQPRLLITLGAEVAGVLRDERVPASQVNLLKARVDPLIIGNTAIQAIHCAHPGILMRGDASDWPNKHQETFLPAISDFLRNSAGTAGSAQTSR